MQGCTKTLWTNIKRLRHSSSRKILREIRYEEFKERPVEFLRDIYTQFELAGFDESITMMESYLSKNNPESRAKYPVPPETYRMVNEFAGDIVNRLGYDLVESPGKTNREI